MTEETRLPEVLVRDAVEVMGSDAATDANTRQRYLEQAIEMVNTAASKSDDLDTVTLLAASTSLMVAASSPQALGQCKEAEPYADVYIVFDGGARRFECTHSPSHSVEIGS